MAEDEATVRTLAQRSLEMRGFRVLVAADGAEALRLAADPATRIDLLVSDVVMPRMSGPELARQMRLARPTLPVVYISGYSDGALAQEAMATGGSFLQKPFDPDALERKVREALARRAGK